MYTPPRASDTDLAHGDHFPDQALASVDVRLGNLGAGTGGLMPSQHFRTALSVAGIHASTRDLESTGPYMPPGGDDGRLSAPTSPSKRPLESAGFDARGTLEDDTTAAKHVHDTGTYVDSDTFLSYLRRAWLVHVLTSATASSISIAGAHTNKANVTFGTSDAAADSALDSEHDLNPRFKPPSSKSDTSAVWSRFRRGFVALRHRMREVQVDTTRFTPESVLRDADKSGDGRLDADDLMTALRHLKVDPAPLTRDDVARLVSFFDDEQDGRADYEDVFDCLVHGRVGVGGGGDGGIGGGTSHGSSAGGKIGVASGMRGRGRRTLLEDLDNGSNDSDSDGGDGRDARAEMRVSAVRFVGGKTQDDLGRFDGGELAELDRRFHEHDHHPHHSKPRTSGGATRTLDVYRVARAVVARRWPSVREREYLTRYFQRKDLNQDGTVSEKVFLRFIRKSGMAMDMSRRQIVTLVESLDPERSHWVPYQTFVDKAISLPQAAPSTKSKGDRRPSSTRAGSANGRAMRVLEVITEDVAAAERRGASFPDAFLAFDPARRGYVTRDLAIEALVGGLGVGYASNVNLGEPDFNLVFDLLPSDKGINKGRGNEMVDYADLYELLSNVTPRTGATGDAGGPLSGIRPPPGATSRHSRFETPTWAPSPFGSHTQLGRGGVPGGGGADSSGTWGRQRDGRLGWSLRGGGAPPPPPPPPLGSRVATTAAPGPGSAEQDAVELHGLLAQVRTACTEAAAVWGPSFELERFFESTVDSARSGMASLNEFQAVLNQLGVAVTASDLRNVTANFGVVDTRTGSRGVDYAEFSRLVEMVGRMDDPSIHRTNAQPAFSRESARPSRGRGGGDVSMSLHAESQLENAEAVMRMVLGVVQQQRAAGIDIGLAFDMNDPHDTGIMDIQDFADSLSSLGVSAAPAHVAALALVFAPPAEVEALLPPNRRGQWVDYRAFLAHLHESLNTTTTTSIRAGAPRESFGGGEFEADLNVTSHNASWLHRPGAGGPRSPTSPQGLRRLPLSPKFDPTRFGREPGGSFAKQRSPSNADNPLNASRNRFDSSWEGGLDIGAGGPGYQSDRAAYEGSFRGGGAPPSPVRDIARDAAVAVWGAGTPLRDKGTLPVEVERELDERGVWFCVTCLYAGEYQATSYHTERLHCRRPAGRAGQTQ